MDVANLRGSIIVFSTAAACVAVANPRQAVALPRTGVEEDVEATVRRRAWRTSEIEQILIWLGGTRLAHRHRLRAERHGHGHGENQKLAE
ncbi:MULTISPECIES: hypothetical protein [unclassified Rhodanobacter]|uniref:Secreted protein n=1 Tax=Rhodanobacter humi TaxID=1888173 RepID=A0ABV4AQW0_9GAMM